MPRGRNWKTVMLNLKYITNFVSISLSLRFTLTLLISTQKVKKGLRELQAKEKELTERRDKCGDAAKKLRTGLRIFKVRDTLLKMGDEGDQARREIVEAERLQFVKELADEKKSLKTFLAEQRVRVPNLSLFLSLILSSLSFFEPIRLYSLCNR